MQDKDMHKYVGLDIGTQNVRCVIGISDQDNPDHISVIGHGAAPNKGMRRGTVSHMDDVADAVVEAVSAAERLAGVHVKAATVNINGSNVMGIDSKGVVAISSHDRIITDEDRLRAEEAATIMQLPQNREIIQVFAKNYRLDGQDNIKNPVGMSGVRLEVDTHIVTASTPNVRNLETVLERANIFAAHKTVSSLAAAEAVMPRQQKEAGTLLLDIGAGTTNFVVIEDGEIQHVAVIPVGGIHITNDLAIGLKTDLDIAEKIKLEHATLSPKDGKIKTVSVKIDKISHSFSVEDVYEIVEARVEEILELCDRELKKIGRSRKLPGGVVLVGGTAKLPGLGEFAREKLELAARVGNMQSLGGLVDSISDPAYSAAVGLMIFDMLLGGSEQYSRTNSNQGFIGSVKSALGKLIN